jgi:hypothetical protein
MQRAASCIDHVHEHDLRQRYRPPHRTLCVGGVYATVPTTGAGHCARRGA